MRIEKDIFNSEHFGIEMGNVYLDHCYEDKNDFLNDEMISNFEKYQHLTLRISTSDKLSTNCALSCGYQICDTLVEWIFDYKKSFLPQLEHKVFIREACEGDFCALMEIGKKSFSIDRFHSDRYLDNELCDKYYEKWIKNSLLGYAEKVLVAVYQKNVVGFTTIKTYKDDKLGHLVLSAVSDSFRGLGIYTSLIYACVEWLIQNHDELSGILVGTQIDNIAVQKAWHKLGFIPHDSKYVLQKHLNGEKNESISC